MSKNEQASALLEFLVEGCRAGVLALTDLTVAYGSRAGSPQRAAFTAESIPGRKGKPHDVAAEELAFWLERFRSGTRRALLVTPLPERGLGPSEKMTFYVTYD
jgi:hypothetical protein